METSNEHSVAVVETKREAHQILWVPRSAKEQSHEHHHATP